MDLNGLPAELEQFVQQELACGKYQSQDDIIYLVGEPLFLLDGSHYLSIIHSVRRGVLPELDLEKEKTGIFTGAYAVNPVNNENVPIWISDYVLAGYGTGVAVGDIDNDADFDLFVTNEEGPDHLYLNETSSGDSNWVFRQFDFPDTHQTH